MNMILGLGTDTFECGLIYLNSLHRGSALYASETYYNLSETDLRSIESPEEDCVRQICSLDRTCPPYLMYLEIGLCPARYHIYKLKLNLLHHILQQKENSLMFRFFEAQRKYPTKGDWVSGVCEILKICDINLTFSDIKQMKESIFESLVNRQIKKSAFIYLKSQIKSKGKEIDFGVYLALQDYLQPNQILTLSEQKLLLSFRVRSNPLQYNTPGTGEIELCECKEVLKNEHLYLCELLSEQGCDNKPPYDAIFNGTLKQQKTIINILIRNLKNIENMRNPPGTSNQFAVEPLLVT